MSKNALKRLRLFMLLVLLVIVALGVRLYWLQIYRYSFFFELAENNWRRELPITAARGEIFDRNGEVLVTNRPGFTVSLLDLPKREQPEVIASLSELLEMDGEQIREEIHRQRFRAFAPILLKRDVSAEVVAQISERRMDLPGVIIETEPIRYYPRANFAAHLLGYIGRIPEDRWPQLREEGGSYRITDQIGITGIERTFENYLRGTAGQLLVEANRFGRRTRELAKKDPVTGSNLHLTINARLQDIVESSLAKIIKDGIAAGNTDLGRGAVVAIDPRNGEILAMASYPAFNPNTRREDMRELEGDPNKPFSFFNRALSGGYPIGSTYKMLVAVAALEEGIINPDSIIVCGGRKRFFSGESPRVCFGNRAHGALNVRQAIAVSCNIFFFELAMRLGIERLTAYAESFAFGNVTGITDLAGESPGVLLRRRPERPWNPGELLNAAIGQGHMISPLQMANYTAILANGGIHYRPHLVKKVVNNQGMILYQAKPEVLNDLGFSDKTWQTVQQGMEATALPGGTAASLRNLPVRVAGKTGSAESLPGKTAHSLFVGYAPAEAPEIAIAIIVEHGGLGFQAAVPLGNLIFSQYYDS